MADRKFHWPVVKEPTGFVQFRIDQASVMEIDRIGRVRRGEVIRAGKLARGLVANGSFSHVAADTPLGVPMDLLSTSEPMNAKEIADMKRAGERKREEELVEDLEALRKAGAFSGPRQNGATDVDAANTEHLATFDGSPESTKKSPK